MWDWYSLFYINFKEKIMQIKVYMSRSSMCMADDVNAPNPGTFILPDTLEGFVSIVDLMLPFYD